MTTRRWVAWNTLLVLLALGVALLIFVNSEATKLVVTVENRTDEPLTNGSYGVYYSPLHATPPPLDRVPAHASVTHVLEEYGNEDYLLHYRVSGREDTVDFGYLQGGGTTHTWVVAEADSLSQDSTVWISHGDTVASFRPRIPSPRP